MLNAADQGLPGVRRQAEELRRRQGQRHEGREEGRAGRRQCRRGGRRHIGGTRRPRSTRCRSSGTKAPTPRSRARPSPPCLKDGLDADQAFVGNQDGDVKAALAGAAKKVEAVYAYPYQNHATMEPMNATALYTAGQVRGLVLDAERRSALAATAEAAGLAGRQVRGLQDFPRRRLRPARGLGRLCRAGGSDRQADAGHAGEAALVARRGHDPRLLPPDHPVQDDRRVRREKQPHRPAHAASPASRSSRTVAPGRMQNGMDPATFAGLNTGGAEAAFGYAIPNLLIDHAMRNPHIPPGFWRGVNINQNAIYHRMLHGRARARSGRGSAGVPPQADGEVPEASRRAQRGRGKGRLGQAGRRRASIAASPSTWASAATSRPAPRSRSTATR